jgi:hypothetical protein
VKIGAVWEDGGRHCSAEKESIRDTRMGRGQLQHAYVLEERARRAREKI